MKPTIITAERFGNPGKGYLSMVQAGGLFPGPIKRLFYIYDLQAGNVRGGHAHRTVTQMFCVVSGRAVFSTMRRDAGKTMPEARTLHTPEQWLLVPPLTWLEISITEKGTVIICLCDQGYEEEEYIRSFEGWLIATEVPR